MYKKFGTILLACTLSMTIFIPVCDKERKKAIKHNIYNSQRNYGSNYDEAIRNAELQINDKTNSEYEKSIYLLLRLFYYYQKNEFDKVLDMSKDVEDNLIKNNLMEELIFFYTLIIKLNTNVGNYSQSYLYIYKCEKITIELYDLLKDEKSLEYLITIRYLRANIAFQLGLEDEAQRVFDEGEELRKKYKGKEGIDMLYNILEYHSRTKNHDSIEEYANKIIELTQNVNYRRKMFIDVNIMLVASYIEIGEIDKCLEILKMLSKEKDITSYEDKYKLYILYSSIYEYYGDINEQIKYLEMSYSEIEYTKMYKQKFSITEDLIEAYEKLGDEDKIHEKNEVYRCLSNELINLNDTPYFMRQILDTDLQYANYQIEFLEFEKNKLTYYIFLCLLFIFSMIIVSLQINKNKKILEQNIYVLNQQMNYQHKYYQNIKQNQLVTRWIWHDMKNHINVIDNLIKRKEYDKAKNYINKVDNKILKLEDLTISNNSIINAILSNKIEKCREKGIDISYDIKIHSKLKIDDFDLSVIFGNLLDNAIEACENINDEKIKRQIKIKSIVQGDYLYISIKNSKNTDVKFDGGKLISLKKDKIHHGIGFGNIKRSVEKYSGEINIDHTKYDFTVKILMHLQHSD